MTDHDPNRSSQGRQTMSTQRVPTEQLIDDVIETVQGGSGPPAHRPLRLIARQLGVGASPMAAFVRRYGIVPVAQAEGGEPLFDVAILSAAVEANRTWFEERAARVELEQAQQRASAEAKRKRVEADALRRVAEREAARSRATKGAPAAVQPLRTPPTTTMRAGGHVVEVYVRRAPGKEHPLGAASGCAHAAHTPVENATTQKRRVSP